MIIIIKIIIIIPFKLLHYWERPEYWEESGRLEDTYSHSNSRERPSANIDVKNPNNNKYDYAELCKKVKLLNKRYIIKLLSKRYMKKTEPVAENDTHKIL